MEHTQARLCPRSTDHPFQFDLTHQLASRLRHWEGPPTGSATDDRLPAAPARRTEPMATAHPGTDDALGELRRALPQVEVLSAVEELQAHRWDRALDPNAGTPLDRKSTRLNSSHVAISYAVFRLKQKT